MVNANIDIPNEHRLFMKVQAARDTPALRRVSHEERMATAEQIAADLVAKYKASVLAVCVYGSTAKQLDRPYSDLEIFCVLSDDLQVPSTKYLINGLIIGIEYRKESEWLEAARKVNLEWPMAADQYRNRIVLFEKDEWLKKLEAAVAENDKSDFTEAIRIAAIAMTESWATVRNTNLSRNSVALKSATYWMAMDTARLVLLLNKRYVHTTTRFWEQAFECPKQPKDFPPLVKTVAGFVNSTVAERFNAAEKLWKETIKLVLAQGIPIESAQLTI